MKSCFLVVSWHKTFLRSNNLIEMAWVQILQRTFPIENTDVKRCILPSFDKSSFTSLLKLHALWNYSSAKPRNSRFIIWKPFFDLITEQKVIVMHSRPMFQLVRFDVKYHPNLRVSNYPWSYANQKKSFSIRIAIETDIPFSNFIDYLFTNDEI